jgi:hypothetical protein
MASLAVFGCAPVASSGPKHSQISSQPGDVNFVDTAKYDLRVVSQAPEILSEEEYETFIKKIDASYKIYPLHDLNTKKAELLETRGMKNLDVSSAIGRADIIVIFVTRTGAPKIAKEKSADLALTWLKRSPKNEFTFKVSEDEKSDEVWTYVKKNLSSISLAYREVAPKK